MFLIYFLNQMIRLLQNSKTCRDWLAARGVYKNTEKTFVAFINGKQLELMSRDGGCDLKKALNALQTPYTWLEMN